MRKGLVFLSVVFLWMSSISWTVAGPLAQEGRGKCLISSPATGSTVRGQVAIVGSAVHPDFTWYQVGYAPDPNPDGKWTFFHSSEQAVENGRLAVWNTGSIPDGSYQLILEVHRSDGNLDLCFVKRLRVNNTAPTPTFTAVPLPTMADTPTPLPTVVDTPTPTAVIEQPPTATPRPTPTYSPLNNPTPTPQMTRIKLPIDPARVRTASCRGAQLAIAVSLVVGLYFVIRNMVVGGVRKVWRPRDVEGFHLRRPREW